MIRTRIRRMDVRRMAVTVLSASAAAPAVAGCADPITIPEPPTDVRIAYVEDTFRGGTSATDLGETFYVSFGAWNAGSSGSGEPDANVFESVPMSYADAGRIVTIASDADDPSFSALIALLTDADDNTVRLGLATDEGASAHSWLESLLMEPTRDVTPGPGFEGLHITKLVLQMLDITVESPGSDPEGDGVWSDYTIQWRVDVFASVR